MRKLLIYFLLTFIYGLNYSEDISPIIYNNCTTCHRPYEIGSFLPFENYQDVYDNRGLIAYVIAADDDSRHGNPFMPPWPYIHTGVFVNSKTLDWGPDNDNGLISKTDALDHAIAKYVTTLKEQR